MTSYLVIVILNSVIIILQGTRSVWYVILFYYLLVILFSYLIVLAVVPFLFSLTRSNYCNLGIFCYHISLPSSWSPLPTVSSLTQFHHQHCVALLTEYIATQLYRRSFPIPLSPKFQLSFGDIIFETTPACRSRNLSPPYPLFAYIVSPVERGSEFTSPGAHL